MINIFKEIKILNKPKNNYITEYILQSMINKEVNAEIISKIFQKNLFIFNAVDLIELYQIYLISRIFNFENVNDFLYKITFKIKFILKNYDKFYERQLKYDIINLYKTLCRLKNFYNLYQNRLEIYENEKINNINYGSDEKTNNSDLLVRNGGNEFDKLFYEEDNRICEELMTKINMFYRIDKGIDLFSGHPKEIKNFDFFHLIFLN